MLKQWFDRVFGESSVETETRYEQGNKIITTRHFKGNTCVFQSVITYYSGLTINL